MRTPKEINVRLKRIILSDNELWKLLPQKEELPSYACNNEDMRLELRNQWHRIAGRNQAIDLCFEALQRKIMKK